MKRSQSPTKKFTGLRFTLQTALCLVLFCAGAWSSVGNALPIARLRRVEPTVQLRHKSAKSWIVARERGAIVYGDTVQTGSKGKADILFANGTKVAMRARSSIEIIEPSNPNNPLIIRVFGALSEVFVRPRGNTQVRTAAAIAAARGTEFIVRLPDENSTQVVVSEGSVDFINEQGQVLIQENQSSVARVGVAPTLPIAIDVSGELAWTADVIGLPLEWRTPFLSLDRASIVRIRKAEESAAKAHPEDVATQLRWGKVLHDLGEYSNAAEVFARLTKAAPENAEVWLALSRAERGRGAGQAALVAAQRALELSLQDNNLSQDATLQIALAQLVLGDTQAAQRVLDPIQEMPQGRAASGLVALREGRVEEAIADLRVALDSPTLQKDASLRTILALSLLSRNESAAALVEARRAVQDEPNFADANGALSSVLFFNGDRKAAETAARRAVSLDIESPLALLSQSRVLLAAGRADEAREAISRAYALAPSPLLATELADAYARLKQWRKAETFYRRALKTAPDFAPAHAGLGVVLQEQGQTKDAEAALARARVLDPRGALVRARLAQLYVEQGQLERAAAELPDGFKLPRTPENALLLVRLSELGLLRDNLFDALEFARRAVVLLPQSGLAHYQLGRVYVEMGRAVQAEEQFRQAVILDPELDKARFALGYVRNLIETGRDISRPSAILNGVNLGASSRAFEQQNLRTPGVEERVQASLSDPTVARTATRAVGDTQNDGVLGTRDQNDASFSHLNESSDRRSLLGVTASRIERTGQVENSDSVVERAGLSIGNNNRSNTAGLFFTANIERANVGLNYGEPLTSSALSRAETVRSGVLFGGYFRQTQNQRTRWLVRGTSIEDKTRRPDDASRRDMDGDSFDFELRHDWRWNRRQLLSSGLNLGRSRQKSELFLRGIPMVFPDQRIETGTRLEQQSFYLRNQFDINSRVTLTGELQRKKLSKESWAIIQEPIFLRFDIPEVDKSFWEPKAVLDVRLSAQSGLRLRAQRVVGDAGGYELLTPTDLFSTSLSNLPQLSIGGLSKELDVEAYHTFQNSSLLRLALFDKKMSDTREASFDGLSGELVPRAHLRGARLALEGSLGKATFFTSVSALRGRDLSNDRELAFVPRLQAEAGMQWLRRDGLFVQPSWLYQGSRIVPREGGFVRERRDGFSLFNLRVGKRLGAKSVFFVEVINIFDRPFDILGVDQPGRRFRIGTSQRF